MPGEFIMVFRVSVKPRFRDKSRICEFYRTLKKCRYVNIKGVCSWIYGITVATKGRYGTLEILVNKP